MDVAADFPKAQIEAVPYKIHTVLTDNGVQFTDPADNTWSPPTSGAALTPHSFLIKPVGK